MNTIVLHGIPNCDTVKKARAWFAARGVAVPFHDFRRDGVPEATLAEALSQLGWERMLNRQGTTWRRLDEATRAAVVDAASAAALMRSEPAVIKRPLVRWPDGRCTVGFDEAGFAQRQAGPVT